MCTQVDLYLEDVVANIQMRFLTFDSEGFADSQEFTVGVDGYLIVQESFVHDESIKLRGICPSQHKEKVIILHACTRTKAHTITHFPTWLFFV